MTDSIQLYDVKVVVRTVNIVDEHRQHHLDEKKKNPNYNATYNIYGFTWAFKDSIPIVNLDPTHTEKIQAWFDSSIPYFNGIVDEDGKGCGDDYVLVSKDNSLDGDCNVCEDASASLSKDKIVNDKLVDEDCNVCDDASAGLSKDNVVNEKSVGNNDQLLLEDGNGLFDSEAGCRNSEEDNENQSANVSIHNVVNEKSVGNNDQLLLEDGNGLFVSEAGCRNSKEDNENQPANVSIHLNSNQTGVDQELGGAANDPMPDEVLDDYMFVLNDEEMIPNVSLDDMKFQHEEENLRVKNTPLEHQPVDELIDAQKDTTNLLPENVKDEFNKSNYVNVVKADYKPSLETVFAANIKSKKKKCGLQKNYVLRSIQERKKMLAMALGSPYGQLGTTTPAPPKIRSMTFI
nr:phospholipase-like protein [Tanacetum cinerariifolium]